MSMKRGGGTRLAREFYIELLMDKGLTREEALAKTEPSEQPREQFVPESIHRKRWKPPRKLSRL